jgi:predicted HicB family RNase H-like nuclease
VGIVHVDIDDELHRDAKALAAQRGEPLKTLVTRAIEREVERLAKEQERRPGRRR